MMDDPAAQSEETTEPAIPHQAPFWETQLSAGACERCEWSFLFPGQREDQRCPHCFRVHLTPMGLPDSDLGELHPPELTLPFTLSGETIAQKAMAFASGIPYPPNDLNPENLVARLERLYLPMWLVDVTVEAVWQADAGFNYQAVSHQGHYNDQRGWASREVTETRTRWEPRLGRLVRTYENITAPAQEDADRLLSRIGEHNLKTATRYLPSILDGAFVRLPNRLPADAWGAVFPALQTAAADECRQASGADHLRGFRWTPDFTDKHWTLMLLPVYSTFYQDDDGEPQYLLVNGHTGRLWGVRRASIRRAQRTSLSVAIIALLLFLGSLLAAVVGVALPAFLPFAGIGMLAGLLLGLSALIPLGRAWAFNRMQTGERG